MSEQKSLWEIGMHIYESRASAPIFDQFRKGVYFVDGQVYAIDLSDIPMDIIIDSIWNFPKLRFLNLEINRLKELPSGISKLKNLEELYLGDNNFREIPEEISELKSLNVLYLNLNNIDHIPSSFTPPPNLVEFNMYKNPISTIDNITENLSDIQMIDFRKCPISETPRALRFINEKWYISRRPRSFRRYIERKMHFEGIRFNLWKDEELDYVY